MNIIRIGSLHPVDEKIVGFVGYLGRTEARVVAEALVWRRDIQNAGFSSVDAFPGDDGEILISGIQDHLTYEVVVESDLTLSCSIMSGDTTVLVISRATRDTAVRSLEEAAAILWTSSGGLREINSTPVRTVSPGSHSGNLPEQMEACL